MSSRLTKNDSRSSPVTPLWNWPCSSADTFRHNVGIPARKARIAHDAAHVVRRSPHIDRTRRRTARTTFVPAARRDSSSDQPSCRCPHIPGTAACTVPLTACRPYDPFQSYLGAFVTDLRAAKTGRDTILPFLGQRSVVLMHTVSPFTIS